MNTKTLYSMPNTALTALFAIAVLLVPALNSSGTVSAQKGERQEVSTEVATPEMIGRALDLKSASGFSAFAENGISDNGASIVKGNVGVARQGGLVKGLNGGNVKGLIQDSSADTLRAQKDYSTSFSAIDQLPCTEVAGGDLGGRRFTPGVYCLSSAALAGEMVLDAEGNANGVFIFKVAGTLRTGKGSSISLVNKAQAPSVFFVADDAAVIGEGSSFKGNLFARNTISINDGATVEGRALSLKGDLELSGNVLGPQAPGVLEICKAIDNSAGTGLGNRVFRFRVAGQIVEVAAGQCSGQISVEAGPITIEELLTGRISLANNGGDSGQTFDGNFQLTSVIALNNAGQSGTSTLGAVNLPLRIANVNVVAGTTADQLRLQFTNRFAIIGVVEVCKDPLDSGVNGNFNFTIDGVTQGNGQPGANVLFSVPTGQCSGPIAVTVPTGATTTNPRSGTTVVREQARPGFIFTSATALPAATTSPDNFANRLQTFDVFANGGGSATITVVAGSDGGSTTAGATSNQTVVFFNNRTAPGQLKVCKIAGPGVPELSGFNFAIRGVAPNAPVAADTPFVQGTNPTPQNGITPGAPATGTTSPNINNGTNRTGSVPQGGTAMDQNLQVSAGPAGSAGSTNGFCQLAAGTFVVDTPVRINELGFTTGATTGTFSTTGSGAGSVVNAGGGATGVQGTVRLTRVTSSTGIISFVTTTQSATVTTAQNNSIDQSQLITPFGPGTGPMAGTFATNANGTTGTPTFVPANTTGVLVPIRRGITEVEFVNVAFSPVLAMKICKVAGAGVPLNSAFTFSVVRDTVGGLLPVNNSTVTVNAGPLGVNPGDQNGFCEFVPGAFNFNSMVTVTETTTTIPGTTTGTIVAPNGITSPTGGVISNVSARSGVISNLGTGVNEIQFVNMVGTAQGPAKNKKRARLVQ